MRKNVTVKFPITELRDFRGRKTGRVKCSIGEHEIFADSADELDAAVAEFIQGAGERPRVAYCESRAEGFRLLVSSHHGVERYRAADPADTSDGLRQLIPLGWSAGDFYDEIDCELAHLAQLSWDGETSPPTWLPKSRREDWARWVDFQRKYRAAIDAGMADSEAHSLACG